MAFTPANEVERLLVASVTDESARPAFYRALLEQDLFILTEGSPNGPPDDPTNGAPRKSVTKTDTQISVPMVPIEGVQHAPIFSSPERIAEHVREPHGYMGMNGRVMFTMLRGSNIILNPDADYGKMFPPHEVESMLNGSIFQGGTHPHTQLDVGGKKALFGQPKVYPRKLVEGLRARFAAMRDIKAAYLAQVFIEGVDSSPHTLIGVETGGQWNDVLAAVGEVVRATCEPDMIVDFVQITSKGDGATQDYLKRDTQPFYRRKRFLGLF